VYYAKHESDPDFLENNAGLGDVELDAVAEAAVKAATTLKASLVMCITSTGDVARAVARHRPDVPVIAFCFSAPVARRLQLHRAVHPVLLTTADAASSDRLLLSSDDSDAEGGLIRRGAANPSDFSYDDVDAENGTGALPNGGVPGRCEGLGATVRMGLLRTEAVRTAKEMGWVRPGDRVVCVDRNKSRHASGGSLDAIRVGTNMKVFTVV
jgi:pyruvate kinase